MKVLLATLNAKYIHTNLAIRLLYALNRDFPGLAWREFTIKEDKDAVAGYCADFDVVAFSCYIWNIRPTLEVARRIKALNPAAKILLGGPEVSYDWEDVIVREEVDYIITGEGEIPFRTFLEQYPNLDAVPGLLRKQDGEIRRTPEAGIFDLENFRSIMPYQFDPPEELRNKVLYLETSRGCPYKCSFCLASLDNKVRYLPQDTLKATLLHLMEHGRTIKFLDRTFNIKRDFTLDIFQFILDHHRPDNVFQFEITADILHPDIIQFIRERVPKGLFRFEIGIQSVNREVNLAVQRKQHFEKTKKIIEQIADKVELHLDLIVGLPLERWDDIRYSFEEVFKLFAPELQLGFLKFLKGTPVRHEHAQHGYVFDPEPPYQIIESNYLSRDELRRLELLEHALEIYWNKKRAVNTLKYVTATYGSFDFLLGLGELFDARHSRLRYSLEDIYTTLGAFAAAHYPTDAVLMEMIALDYYLFHKIKPAPLFRPEIDRSEKAMLLRQLGLNPNQYRYVALPLSFDYALFERENVVADSPSVVVIQYDGKEKPVSIIPVSAL